MTTERDARTRIVLSWLREDAHENAEHVLLRALDEVDTTPQRRSLWPARRPSDMNNLAKVLIATAAVVAVAVVGINLLPRGGSGPGSVSPSPSTSPTVPPSPPPSPTPAPTASLVTHVLTPFGPTAMEVCSGVQVDPSCVADPRAASITFTFEAPASWKKFDEIGVWIDGNGPPDGADLMIYRGSWLYSDPCLEDDLESPDIPIGPTVDDLVTALVDHPSLDVTSPVDVTLAGYSGKYLDLQIPDDTSACAYYKPLDGHHYAQGPGQRWHMWVLDVGGVRVLVETNDFPETTAQRLAEEQAMIDSLEINP